MAEAAVADRIEASAPAEPPGPWFRSLASPGWIPAFVALAVTAATLHYYDVRWSEIARYGLYEVGCVTLPGLLIWRALRGRSGYLAFDAAAGVALGLAVELPLYLLLRQLGVPYAIVGWPIATVLTFVAVPRLRRHWRGGDRRLPVGVSCSVALAFLLIIAHTAASNFKYFAIHGPGTRYPYYDLVFQVGLVGEFKHSVPLNTPWVAGVPLKYHWFVYVHGAATSWITGIEPLVLVNRLLPLAMVVAFLVLMIAIAHRLTGRWWVGNLALLLMVIGQSVSPFAWVGVPTYNGRFIDHVLVSPTQTLAAVLFAAAIYVFIDLLRGDKLDRAARIRSWVVFAALTGGVSGAKATFLPMFVCGLLLAVVLRLVTRQRPGPALPALGITLAWMAFAQVVVFGGGSQGTHVQPLQTVKWTQLGMAVLGKPIPDDPWNDLVVLTLLSLLGTAFAWVGLVGLLRRPWRTDPVIHVLFGTGVAGFGALYVLAHPGLSQNYFARSASPYLALLSAIGFSALVPAGRWSLREASGRRVAALIAGAVALGALTVVGVQATTPKTGPEPQTYVLADAVTPYLKVLGLLLVAAVVLALAGRALRLGRSAVAAAILAAVLAAPVMSGTWVFHYMADELAGAGPKRNVTVIKQSVPTGGLTAARWLRDHSDPRDLVATNSHCPVVFTRTNCDSRDFWVASYAERQVLVEGWSYTEPALSSGGLYDGILANSKFWDPALLAENDAIFRSPTAASVADFARTRRVRWLVAVDKGLSPDLDRYATLRYRSGDVRVYELPRP
jgi:hypothetical protein